MSADTLPVTVVCGSSRSGCSLVMQMLDAAGMICAGEYPGFDAGLSEQPTADWVRQHCGRAFKLVNPHQVTLPSGFHYRFIHVTRSRKQQALSTVKVWTVAGMIEAERGATDQEMARMEESLQADEWAAQDSIAYHDGECLRITFEDLIARPESAVWRLADFLGLTALQPEMRACVFPRSTACFSGILEVDLVGWRESRAREGGVKAVEVFFS